MAQLSDDCFAFWSFAGALASRLSRDDAFGVIARILRQERQQCADQQARAGKQCDAQSNLHHNKS